MSATYAAFRARASRPTAHIIDLEHRRMDMIKLNETDAARRDRTIAEANAMRQDIAEMRIILAGLCKIIEETQSNSEGHYPIADHTCVECTAGTSPHNGTCAYHRAKARLCKVVSL